MMEEEADDIVFDSVQLIKKRGTDSKRTRDRICHRPEQLRKGRLARTCFIFASFVCLGLSAAVTGPTLPYFMQKFQLDVGKLAYIYTACCFGYMIGSVVGSVVFEQFGRDHLLLGGGMAAGALGLALAPFASSLLMLCCVLAVTGLANGFLYSGGVALCSRQWGSRSSSVIEWLYFAVSIGALVAPLLCAAFITEPTSAAASVGPKGAAVLDVDASPEVGRPIALPKRDVPVPLTADSMNSTAFSSSLPILPLPTSSDNTLLTTSVASAKSLVSDPVTVIGVRTTVESSSSSSTIMSSAASLIPSTTVKLKKPVLANGAILSQNTDDAAGRALGHRVNTYLAGEKPHDVHSPHPAPPVPSGPENTASVSSNSTNHSAAVAAAASVTDLSLNLSSTSNFTSRAATTETDAQGRSTWLDVSDETATVANNSSYSGSGHSDPVDNRSDESTASLAAGSQISSTLSSFVVTASNAPEHRYPMAANGTTVVSSAVLSSANSTDEAATQLATNSIVTSRSIAATTDSNVSVSLPPSAHAQTNQNSTQPMRDLDSLANLTVPAAPTDRIVTSPEVEMTSEVSSTLSRHWTTITSPVNVGTSISGGTHSSAATTPADQSDNATADTGYSSSQGDSSLTTFGATLSDVQPTIAELRTVDPNSFITTTNGNLVPGSWELSVTVGNGIGTAGPSTVTDAGRTRSAPIDRHTHSAYIDDIQFVYLIASAVLLLVAVGFMCLSVDDRDSVVQPPSAQSANDSLATCDDGCSSSALARHASLTPTSRLATDGGGVKFASRILALTFVVCVLYVGVEVASGQLLAAYAMRSAAVPGEHRAALLVAAFWGTFALVRGLAAIAFASSSRQLCPRLSPAVLLVCGLAISCMALIVLSFFGGDGDRPSASAMWAGSALLGGGLAPVFPACLAWTQQYMDLGATRIRAALVGGSSLGGMVLPAVAGYILEHFPPSYALYALLGTVAACASAYALAWYTAAAAHGCRLACCFDGRASYEAIATDALPMDDGFGYPQERTSGAEHLHRKRNTGHKTVSFRLLDEDSDKDV